VLAADSAPPASAAALAAPVEAAPAAAVPRTPALAVAAPRLGGDATAPALSRSAAFAGNDSAAAAAAAREAFVVMQDKAATANSMGLSGEALEDARARMNHVHRESIHGSFKASEEVSAVSAASVAADEGRPQAAGRPEPQPPQGQPSRAL